MCSSDLNLLNERGNKAGAEAAFRAAIAADPQCTQHANAHGKLGVLLMQRGDKAGGEAALRAAIAADPQHASAHSMRDLLARSKAWRSGRSAP